MGNYEAIESGMLPSDGSVSYPPLLLLDLQDGDSAGARKRLENAVRRLQQAGSVVLARQVERESASSE